MAVLANTFREKLDAGESTIGTHFCSTIRTSPS